MANCPIDGSIAFKACSYPSILVQTQGVQQQLGISPEMAVEVRKIELAKMIAGINTEAPLIFRTKGTPTLDSSRLMFLHRPGIA